MVIRKQHKKDGNRKDRGSVKKAKKVSASQKRIYEIMFSPKKKIKKERKN